MDRSNSSGGTSSFATPSNFSGQVETCPVSTLEKELEGVTDVMVTFLKIDVEGAEPLVLQGAMSLLKTGRIATVLVECEETNLQRMGFSFRDVAAPL